MSNTESSRLPNDASSNAAKPNVELTELELGQVAGGGVINHEEQYSKKRGDIIDPADPSIVSPRDPASIISPR